MHRNSQRYYDLLYTAQGKDYRAEAQAIADLIRDHRPDAQTVLDVGCGTGRHAKILRDEFGLAVDGVDIDPDMIAIARKANPDAHFDVGDMCDFDTGRKYDAVISMFSAIGYVRTLDNIERALERMRAHTSENGLVVVEPWIEPQDFTGGKTFMDTAEDGAMKLCRMSRNEVENRLSRIFFHWQVCTPESVERFDETLELGLFTREEMLGAFAKAGLDATYDRAEGRFADRGLYVARPAP